jgi:nitrogen fixation protein NifQ
MSPGSIRVAATAYCSSSAESTRIGGSSERDGARIDGHVPHFDDLVRASRFPGDLRTIAFAGVMARALETGRRPLIRGMTEYSFQRLLRVCFPGVCLENGCAAPDDAQTADEFDDLLNLLLDYRGESSQIHDWLSFCIASASMQDQHLWQDMGLPNRAMLSRLLRENFPDLAARNVGDMKWKKFFYRQLCERSGLVLCRSPNCADCSDFPLCFSHESSTVPVG